MARKIQSQSARSQASPGAILGLLANGIFWLAIAILLPIRAIVDVVPGLAPYAQWGPVPFYALAFWSFIRAVRVLQRFAGNRTPAARATASTGIQAGRLAEARKGKTEMGAPVNRTPTVQRMR